MSETNVTVTEVRGGNTSSPVTMESEKIFKEAGKEYEGVPTKSWIFVRNNYTSVHEQMLKDMEKTLMVFGREKGELRETPHLQGFITFKQPKRFGGLKKMMPGFHIAPALSQESGFNYCLKELDYEIDDRRVPGKRNDILEMKDKIDQGCSKVELWDENFESMVHCHRGMYEYMQLKNKQIKRPELQVVWVIGPSGSGKSTWVDKEFPDAYWLTPSDGKMWWDGYDGEEAVVVDDFRPNFYTYEGMLKLLNSRGKYRINLKGSSGWLACSTIVFTSIDHPKEMYSMYDKQLDRRITEWMVFEDD